MAVGMRIRERIRIEKKFQIFTMLELSLLTVFFLFVLINTALVVLVHGANSFTRDNFPPGFVFGAGSSAYQVGVWWFFLFYIYLYTQEKAITLDFWISWFLISSKILGLIWGLVKVEGASNQDGRTPSIWDTFAQAGNHFISFSL